MDALGIEGARLVGHDWGGIVASSAALKYPDRFSRLALLDTLVSDALALANPLNAEHTHVRASLLPGLLDALAHNLRNHNDLRRVFETGRVLQTGPRGVMETLSVGFAILTKPTSREWNPEATADLYEAKLCAQRLLEAVGVSMPKGGLRPLKDSPAWQDGHAASAGEISKNRVELKVGYCNLSLTRRKEMNGPVLCGELLVDPEVLSKKAKPVKFQGFGSFPPALKDLALVVDEEVHAEDVRCTVHEAAKKQRSINSRSTP